MILTSSPGLYTFLGATILPSPHTYIFPSSLSAIDVFPAHIALIAFPPKYILSVFIVTQLAQS